MGTAPALREVLPASHILVPVQHPLPQLLGLNSSGELKVGELTAQQFRFQEALRLGGARQERESRYITPRYNRELLNSSRSLNKVYCRLHTPLIVTWIDSFTPHKGL